jgi:uncharacterized protein (TIGR03492 family)
MLEPVHTFPSGGFGARGRGFLDDVRAGGFGFLWRQRRTLRAQRGRYDEVVAVGDTFCLWMAAAAGAPPVLVATAKSSRHDPHHRLDVAIMRRLAARVFARDADTARDLSALGIDAAHVGNPLMDAIDDGAGGNQRRPDRHVVVLLPGSRQGAYRNLTDLLHLADVVGQRVPVGWLCAVAPTLTRDAVADAATDAGWSAGETTLRRGTAEVVLTSNFGAAVREADIVVSLAGSASEQAAGLGKPVVAFPGSGPQFTPRFLAAQQRLLGDALVPSPTWTEAAAAVLRLLDDPEERLRRGAAGRLRMGPSGAIERISKEILAQVSGSGQGSPVEWQR